MTHRRGELLVAIINNTHDWHYAYDDHWYRIPVSSVRKYLKDRWPPRWLAFYQTKVPTIIDTINAWGGADGGAFVPWFVDPDTDSPRQMSLFD